MYKHHQYIRKRSDEKGGEGKRSYKAKGAGYIAIDGREGVRGKGSKYSRNKRQQREVQVHE